jgi:hypothetical protein
LLEQEGVGAAHYVGLGTKVGENVELLKGGVGAKKTSLDMSC